MNRKNRFEKLKPDIDLTPLLDVIFIVLMVVMCNVNLKSATALASEDTASEEQISESMKEQLIEELSEMEDRICFVIVYADFDDADPSNRRVRFTVNGEEDAAYRQIDITADTEDEAYADIETYIGRILEDKAGIPTWVSVDDSQILYRDYVRLQSLLSDMHAKGNTDLYISGSVLE